MIRRGYCSYLVMFEREADRISAGAKYGVTVSFETLERDYHETTCPENWLKHKHKRREG